MRTPYTLKPDAALVDSLWRRGLKLSHLRLAAQLADAGTLSAAAERLGISQPAASRLAAELGRILGEVPYRREGQGIVPTPSGAAFARRAVAILRELGDAGREIAELRSGLAGTVRIGSVTGPAIEKVLPVIRAARGLYPAIEIAVEVATSDVLLTKLASGELDFALGRLPRGSDPTLYDLAAVGTEPLAMVARRGHPLLTGERVPLRRLADFDWVMPFEGAILRTTMETALAARGLQPQRRVLSTSSFLLTLATLRQSDAIAPIASAVAGVFAGPGDALGVIDCDLTVEVEPYSLIRLLARTPTPAVARIFDLAQQECGLAEGIRTTGAGRQAGY